MNKTAVVTQDMCWKKFGSHEPVPEKNRLIETCLKCADVVPFDRLFREWTVTGISRLFTATTQLIDNIKAISSDIIVYATTVDAGIEELIVTTTTFEKDVFDKITDYILEYEDCSKRRIYYYYAAAEDLKHIPEDVTVYRGT